MGAPRAGVYHPASAGSGGEQVAEERPGGGRAEVAAPDGAADEATLAVDEVDRRRAPDAVDAAGDVAALVEQDRCGVAALLHGATDQVGGLAKRDEQDLEPLALELTVQRVDGRQLLPAVRSPGGPVEEEHNLA